MMKCFMTSPETSEVVYERVKEIAKTESHVLGFVPMSERHKGGLGGAFDKGHVVYVCMDDDPLPCGYCLWSESRTHITIVQMCVAKEFRRRGAATAMYMELVNYSAKPIQAKVRGDLIANLFWLTTGSKIVNRIVHATSERLANVYERPGRKVETIPGDPEPEKMNVPLEVAINAGKCLAWDCKNEAGTSGYCAEHKRVAGETRRNDDGQA